MSHPSDLTRTLDENLARATPARSIFTSEERTLENGSREESLECFNSLYAAAAEGLSENTPCEPIGQGQPKERKKVGPMELAWEGEAWTATGAGFSLEIGPECDKNDTQGWLENFERIRTNVLRRQTTKRERLHFLLGRKANEREPKRCVAFAEDNTFGFPITLNGSHLLALILPG